MKPISTEKLSLQIMSWLLAFALALAADRAIAQYMHEIGIDAWLRSHSFVRGSLKAPGEIWFCLAAAAYVLARSRYRSAVPVAFALALVVSSINGGVKWIVGRLRPYKLADAWGAAHVAPFQLEPFRGGFSGMFHQSNLCFPSGHASLAFAVAAAAEMLAPRAGAMLFVAASVVAIERVAENAHWASDVVGGAMLGVLGMRWAVALTGWAPLPDATALPAEA